MDALCHVALLGISGNQNLLTPEASMVPALFAKLSASLNPFVYSFNHPKIWREIVRRFHCSSVDNVSFDNGDNTAGLAGDARSRFIPRNNLRDVQNSRTQNSQNSGGIPLVSFTNQRMLNNRMDSSSSGQSFGPDVMATNLPHSRSEQYFSSYSSDFRRPPTRPRLTLN